MANQQKQQVDQKETASSNRHTFLVDDETYEIYEVEEEAEHYADEEMIGADDDENLLIQNTDGTMSIKIKTEQDTTVLVEHVCGKCRKSYKSVESLKLHMRLCRTMPSSSSTPQVGAAKSRRVIKTLIKNDVDDNNVVEIDHICGKCSKSYKSIGGLQRHMNLCRNMPKVDERNKVSAGGESATIPSLIDDEMEDVTVMVDDLDEIDEDICFCCLENKETAHNGHIRCQFCPKSFKSHINLERHLFYLHAATNEFACSSCNATCATQRVLDVHSESHIEGKPFSCQLCGKDFTRRYHLERHLLYTACDGSRPKKLIPCRVCQKVFSRMDNLREHLRGHMGEASRRKDFQCPYCVKSFYGSSLLNIHIRTHTGEKPFPCDLCDKAFPSNGALRKHRRSHTGEKPYACLECGKLFSAKETLNRHMRIHTGVRPHGCNVCDKRFIQATQLRAHMFQHTGQDGFKCNICSQSFNRKIRLTAHMNSVHVQSETQSNKTVMNYQCDVCDEKFEFKKNLKLHMKKEHTNTDSVDKIKKSVCNICEKLFASPATLYVHQKIHVQEAPVTCKVCKRVFNRLDTLVRHMRNKHNDILHNIITDDSQPRPAVAKETVATNGNDTPIVGDLVEAKVEGAYSIVLEESDDDATAVAPKQVTATRSMLSSATDRQQKTVVVDELSEPLNDAELTVKVGELLKMLVDENILHSLGWPHKKTKCVDVLDEVLQQCGQEPVDDAACGGDYGQKLRENTKLLFTTVIDNESIRELLNNHSVDEVILHVLKLVK